MKIFFVTYNSFHCKINKSEYVVYISINRVARYSYANIICKLHIVFGVIFQQRLWQH